LTEVLEVNWVILYFVYGQVFFVVGLVTALQWRRQSSLELARPLPWLTAFGIAHALNEWGYIFVPLQAVYLADQVVRLIIIFHLLLLAVSFFFLFQFGIELFRSSRSPQWLRAVPGLALLAWAVAVILRGVLAQESLNVLVSIGDGWSRYLLCLPGAVLAHLGLRRQAYQVRTMGLPRIAIYLTGAALAFAVYAFFGGVIVPAAPVFPASVVNYTLVQQTVHLPVPIFRSICGLAMAFFVTRFLQVFQVETDHRIDEMERAQLLTADRERIGRELHDGIIQNLYAAGLGLEEARYLLDEDPRRAGGQIGTVMAALNQIIGDIRRYIFDLRAAEQSSELETVLETLVQDLRLDTLLEVDLEVTGRRCCVLSDQKIAHFTQVAREALSNVAQHAEASRVWVNLDYRGKTTCLTVSDDGRGLGSPEERSHDGHGLTNMQARAKMLGGELLLESPPEGGLKLTLVVPCGQEGDRVIAEVGS